MSTAPRRWRVRPAAKPLRGAFSLPGDKSIGHRALLFSALASGASTLRNLSGGDDNRRTRTALEALGVAIVDHDGAVQVTGAGLDGFRAPSDVIDCGNSGTTLRLLAGLLVAQPFASRLTGDDSLRRRPMGRVTRPLRQRGARIEGVIDPARRDEVPPLDIGALDGAKRLFELEYALPVASAQVKSCLLLSGLWADGVTSLREPTVSRDHTERMLSAMGAPLRTMGPAVHLDPAGWDGSLAPLDLDVPGDPSSAAFFAVAAHLVPGSRVQMRGVCTNPTRTGFFEVLRDQGGGVAVVPKGERGGEPVGDLHVGVAGTGELRRGARVGGELAVRSIDEIPALVAAAAASPGESRFDDVGELRVKESDRIAALVAMVRAFGLDADATTDGLRVRGGKPRGAVVRSEGDHRIAMAGAVLALAAEGETVVDDVACVDTSFPGFADILRGLGADIEVES
ncbi:MAG: 3-phosphoshikimate 1-carboxyvinyltransferase [Polyangiales bacterium]